MSVYQLQWDWRVHCAVHYDIISNQGGGIIFIRHVIGRPSILCFIQYPAQSLLAITINFDVDTAITARSRVYVMT